MYSPFIRITGKGPQMLMRTSKIRSEKPAHRRVFSFCQTCKVHYISMPESCQTNGSGITLHGLSLVTVQALLKTMRLLCITASVGRSRSVKNAADTKLMTFSQKPGAVTAKPERTPMEHGLLSAIFLVNKKTASLHIVSSYQIETGFLTARREYDNVLQKLWKSGTEWINILRRMRIFSENGSRGRPQ